jgi:hypothetical protein
MAVQFGEVQWEVRVRLKVQRSRKETVKTAPRNLSQVAQNSFLLHRTTNRLV